MKWLRGTSFVIPQFRGISLPHLCGLLVVRRPCLAMSKSRRVSIALRPCSRASRRCPPQVQLRSSKTIRSSAVQPGGSSYVRSRIRRVSSSSTSGRISRGRRSPSTFDPRPKIPRRFGKHCVSPMELPAASSSSVRSTSLAEPAFISTKCAIWETSWSWRLFYATVSRPRSVCMRHTNSWLGLVSALPSSLKGPTLISLTHGASNPSLHPTCVSPLRGLPHAGELQRYTPFPTRCYS